MKFEWAEHIRKRPGMYVGDLYWTGFINMMQYLLDGLIRHTGSHTIIQARCLADNVINLTVNNIDFKGLEVDINNVARGLYLNNFGLVVLTSISKEIKITIEGTATILVMTAREGDYELATSAKKTSGSVAELNFKIDESIFKSVKINYAHLNLFFAKIAYLNPGIKIISIDESGHECQRNVFHYIGGVSCQLDELLSSVEFSREACRMDFKTTIDGFDYQVSFCYEHLHQRPYYIRSYANNQETYLGGSLVNGVLSGLAKSIKKIAAGNETEINISKRKLKENLILIAAVRGENFQFSGSTKWTLDMPLIKKVIDDFIYKSILEFAEKNKKK